MTDLFGGLLDQPPPVAKVAPQPNPKPAPICQPDTVERKPDLPICKHEPRLVASFACPCGGQEEVLEPAPATVDCWHCKRKLTSARWWPATPPPVGNARAATAAELERIPRE